MVLCAGTAIGWAGQKHVAKKFRALDAMLAKHSPAQDMWNPMADQIAEFLWL